jgi:hypothetical protein
MGRSVIQLVGLAAGVTVLVIATAPPASAHAIVDLEGDPAYAGHSSRISLEIQHGCLQNESGVDTVIIRLGRGFRFVQPGPVDGWKVSAQRTSKGAHKVVYTLTGSRPTFSTPTFFPLTIGWPKKPGVYGVPVKQKCKGAVNVWDVPDGPATANQPSPPLYPLPQIQVLKPR